MRQGGRYEIDPKTGKAKLIHRTGENAPPETRDGHEGATDGSDNSAPKEAPDSLTEDDDHGA